MKVDESGKTQIVIVFRYINKSSDDRFWGYLGPESVNAEVISKCILE